MQQFACNGAISANRLVMLNSSREVTHCGATDATCIGATVGSAAGAAASTQPFATGPMVIRKCEDKYLEVTVAAGDAGVVTGVVAYQAADGKLASTGSVRVGVVMTGAAAGSVAKVMAC